jgi:hypothetical protein
MTFDKRRLIDDVTHIVPGREDLRVPIILGDVRQEVTFKSAKGPTCRLRAAPEDRHPRSCGSPTEQCRNTSGTRG